MDDLNTSEALFQARFPGVPINRQINGRTSRHASNGMLKIHAKFSEEKVKSL
eukprot:CAMPEP_0168756720 /NCGR_PEP_ID=MMETSP0724-20121128/20769_1 /TAXON_ID=265536 /ORGANISM="Amphiprora sp., Strain CCMP467" /LENGTH=51 /DNA_ID=CAMNT_0008805453 /DNA_START=1 /DNA_END=152 /DNA_ORIENTATION=-